MIKSNPDSAASRGAKLQLASTDQPARSKAVLLFCLAILFGLSAQGVDLPADWPHEQQFSVAAPSLIKLSLPVETLNAARPGFEDLRLYDNAGIEVPYWIERPLPSSKAVQRSTSFLVALNPTTTVITLATGQTLPLEGLTLESPATAFIKAVQVEGSPDGNRWQTLSTGQVVFRQPGGASQLHLAIPPKAWPWLRLTIDDQRSQPIPWTGAQVCAAATEPVPAEPLPVAVTERHENPGETRLTLNLGAANLNLASIQIETTEPLFTRQTALAVAQVSEDAIREKAVAQGVIYRVAVEGQPAAANLSLPLETQVRSRELLLLIKNLDSPPLSISGVRAERRPVYLVFLARQSGIYHLLSGNSRCPAPRYDLATLGASLKTAAVTPVTLSPPADNPSYHAPEALPGIQADGAALDISAWKFRKAVKLARTGAQQTELELDLLSHAQPGFQDLRLLRDGKQVPYILEHTSISRSLTPSVLVTNDARDPKLSRWILQLPRPALPLARLSCATRTPLFQREIIAYEQLSDERGEKYRRTLCQTSWVQTPGRASSEFALLFDSPPQTDTLFLETHNGDNPPIILEKFQLFYPATRLLFKAKAGDELFLYYGNPGAAAPRYDLSLVADQLLAADKTVVSPAGEEQLKKPSWSAGQTPGKGGVIFWGILALVVVVLLAIISRLLPRNTAQ